MCVGDQRRWGGRGGGIPPLLLNLILMVRLVWIVSMKDHHVKPVTSLSYTQLVHSQIYIYIYILIFSSSLPPHPPSWKFSHPIICWISITLYSLHYYANWRENVIQKAKPSPVFNSEIVWQIKRTIFGTFYGVYLSLRLIPEMWSMILTVKGSVRKK